MYEIYAIELYTPHDIFGSEINYHFDSGKMKIIIILRGKKL